MKKIVKLPKPSSNESRIWLQALMMFGLISMLAGIISWCVWTYFAYDGSPISNNDLWTIIPTGIVYIAIGFILLSAATFLPTPLPSAGNLFLEIARRAMKIMIGLYLVYTFGIIMMLLTDMGYTNILLLLGGCFFGTSVLLITAIAQIKT